MLPPRGRYVYVAHSTLAYDLRRYYCYICCNLKLDQKTRHGHRHYGFSLDYNADAAFYEPVATLDLGFELYKQ
jgi:hypothetical protein